MFRSCLIPGQPYSRLTPLGGEPPESNIAKAQAQPLATVAGLWRLCEETLAQQLALQGGGLCHGDSQLHNCIVSPAPLETVLIDFEAAQRKDSRRRAALAAALRSGIWRRCCARRSTCSARWGGSPVALGAAGLGADGRPVQDRPGASRPPSRPAPSV